MPTFVPTFVSADVPVPIVHFTSSEIVDVIETIRWLRSIATIRDPARIATSNIETAIDMAMKACRAVKPRASTDEGTTNEPFGAVVAVRSAGVWLVVIVAVRTSGFGSDVDTDLGLYFGSGRRQANAGDNGSESIMEFVHEFSSQSFRVCMVSNVGPPSYSWIPEIGIPITAVTMSER